VTNSFGKTVKAARVIMKVLVTGHKGYIGSAMVPMLIKAGHTVVGMDSDFYRRCTFSDGIVDVPSITRDIRDAQVEDFDGVDAVIHLAALSNDPLGDLNPDITYDINHLGTLRLATMAKEAGVGRFLFSSSCSNYGASDDRLLDESAAFNPVTPYGISKVRAELDLRRLAGETFSPVFMRSATAYGVSPRLRFDIVLNNLTAWAVASGKIHIKSDGSPWRPIVHIEDISRGFIAALHAPRDVVHNQAFNVGRSDENYRISEIAQIVKETVPDCEVEFAKDAGPDSRNYRVDATKIAKLMPEFRPQWTARAGAKQLYDAFKSIQLTVDDFEGPTYKRIDQIKSLMSDGHLDASLRWSQPEGIKVTAAAHT